MFIKNALLSIALVLSTSIVHADEAAAQLKKDAMPRRAKGILSMLVGSIGAGVTIGYLVDLKENEYKKTRKGLALHDAEVKLNIANNLIDDEQRINRINSFKEQIETEFKAKKVLELEAELAKARDLPIYSSGEKQKLIDEAIAEFKKAKLMGNEASMRFIAARVFLVLSLINLGDGAFMILSSEE